MDAIRDALQQGITSKANFLANIVLFLPIGFFGGCAGSDGTARRQGVRSAMVLVAALLVSVTIEALQVFVPGRTAAISDVGAQVIGTACGLLGWRLVGQEVSDWVRRAEEDSYQAITTLLVLFALGRTLFLLLPLDVTVSLSTLAEKYRSGRLIVVPFTGPEAIGALIQSATLNAFAAAPLGVLALIGGQPSGRRRGIGVATFLATLFLGAVELCQVIVVSRVADTGDIITGAIGALGGAWVASLIIEKPAAKMRRAHGSAAAATGLLICLAGVTVYNWSPFDFQVSSELLRDRWSTLFRLPFYGYYETPELQALSEFMVRLMFGLIMGVCCRLVVPPECSAYPRLRLAGCAAGLVTFLLLVEIGQMFLPSRTADITDVIIAGVGVLTGLLLPGMVSRRGV